MENWMALFAFSGLDRKHPFCANLVQKIKIVSLSWNLVPRLIRICKIEWWCSLFPFLARSTFWGKLGPKNSNCPSKLRLGTKTNSNMQNSLVVLTLSVLEYKRFFWANVVQNIESSDLVRRLIIRICRIQWHC